MKLENLLTTTVRDHLAATPPTGSTAAMFRASGKETK
jgi:hypothetical protein